MQTLGPRGMRWLKVVHLLFVCMWVGGAISLVLMNPSLTAESGGELFGIDRAMRFVDDWVIIPGAFGCLLTGLVFSIWTRWGFFRHAWVTVKWLINVAGILFGSFFLGPWLNSLAPLAKELGLGALSDPTYLHNQAMNFRWSLAQVSTLLFALAISVLKPWSKKSRRRDVEAGND